ncbi:MAG: hypothetical protein GY795_12065 [Desulfobacterales bacterium]|nr:hypothetical protein [Desulfobacterales bacterium]
MNKTVCRKIIWPLFGILFQIYNPKHMTRLMFDQALETMNKTHIKTRETVQINYILLYSHEIRQTDQKTGFPDTDINYRHL